MANVLFYFIMYIDNIFLVSQSRLRELFRSLFNMFFIIYIHCCYMYLYFQLNKVHFSFFRFFAMMLRAELRYDVIDHPYVRTSVHPSMFANVTSIT